MKPGGGKRKGAAFERHVCEILSHIVTGGASRFEFWRSACSGGRATVGQRKGKDLGSVAGDVCCVGDNPNANQFAQEFFVECKHVKSLDLHRLHRGEGFLAKVWNDEVMYHPAAIKKEKMLIAKQDRGPTIVMMMERALPDCFGLEPDMTVHRLEAELIDWDYFCKNAEWKLYK